MKDRTASKSSPNFSGLMESVIKGGTRLVACTLSMAAMGIRREELIDGIGPGGLAEFPGATSTTGINRFI